MTLAGVRLLLWAKWAREQKWKPMGDDRFVARINLSTPKGMFIFNSELVIEAATEAEAIKKFIEAMNKLRQLLQEQKEQ